MWDKYTIEKDKTFHWKLGHTVIWVRKIDNEWLIANESIKETHEQSVYSSDSEPPDIIKWNSIITDKSRSLNVLPAVPDRPVIVKPRGVFKLLPGMNIQLYIHIPLWIQIYHGSVKNENLIYEFPSIGLSSTWFGESDNGILSYTNPKEVFTHLDTTKYHQYEAICPVKITNNDSEILNFQRLLLNVEFLSIYSDGNLLFTSEINVRFKGENAIADIQYSNAAPAFLENTKQVATPRNLERKNVLKKGFHFIKSLTDY